MLVIRQQQMQALFASCEQAMHERAANWIQQLWPSVCEHLTRDELLGRVRSDIAAGRGFGFSGEYHPMQFLNFRFGLGAGFPGPDVEPWAKAILVADYPPADKISLVLAGLHDPRTFSRKGGLFRGCRALPETWLLSHHEKDEPQS